MLTQPGVHFRQVHVVQAAKTGNVLHKIKQKQISMFVVYLNFNAVSTH